MASIWEAFSNFLGGVFNGVKPDVGTPKRLPNGQMHGQAPSGDAWRPKIVEPAPVAEQAIAGTNDSVGVTEHATFPLSGAAEFQDEISRCEILMELDIQTNPDRANTYLAYTKDGDAIGRISEKQAVAKALNSGQVVLAATINSCGTKDAKGRFTAPRVRIVTGPKGSSYSRPVLGEKTAYPVGLVGEQHYQDAVRRCAPGDEVILLHEVGNPFDKNAIVALDRMGQTLGYIPKDNWLYEAINSEGQGCQAWVLSYRDNPTGYRDLTIEVTMGGNSLGTRRFCTPAA